MNKKITKQLNNLAVEISKREGLKKQVNIAQIKEILAVLSDIAFEKHGYVLLPNGYTIGALLYSNGFKRMLKKTKCKR